MSDELLKEFAKDFIAERNDCLAHGRVEDFKSLYLFFFDHIIATSLKYKCLSQEELADLRRHTEEFAEKYALEHMPNA